MLRKVLFIATLIILVSSNTLLAHFDHPLKPDWIELKNSGFIISCLNGIKLTHTYIFCDGSTHRTDGVLQNIKILWDQVKRMRYEEIILLVEK